MWFMVRLSLHYVKNHYRRFYHNITFQYFSMRVKSKLSIFAILFSGFFGHNESIRENETTLVNTTFNDTMASKTFIGSSLDTDSLTSSGVTIPTTSKDTREFLDYSMDYPLDDEKPCYFLQDIVNASAEILSKRCQRTIYGKVI